MLTRWLYATIVILLVAGYAGFALLQPVRAIAPVTTFSFSRKPSEVQLDWPALGVAAVGASGFGVLATHGSDTPAPTASTIKILTALSVLKQYPLTLHEQGPAITINQADMNSLAKYIAANGSLVPVKLGEQLSEYQALQALLIPSANNIAETLARWAFGSIDAYNTYANTYALTLGMTSTHVTDPSGFMATTTSTPHDLVLLGEAALQNPVISDIMSQPSVILPVVGKVHNYNALLGQNGIIGVKTGNNDQDPGAYIVASQQKVGMRSVVIVAAVMNGANLWSTMSSSLPLLESAARNFSAVTAVHAGETVGTYQARWSDRIEAVAAHTAALVIWNGSATSSSVQIKKLSVPGRSGEPVGTLTLHNSITGDTTLGLVIERPINGPNIWWKLTHPVR